MTYAMNCETCAHKGYCVGYPCDTYCGNYISRSEAEEISERIEKERWKINEKV